ncbi:acyl-CoA dehydrogenase family protein [Streptosporangium sp. NPDC000095]|uniref:acyl-CoA dehydrogenase family protein n=1 Tax=Streptosporangium sp. NPDC000095 TaxID=3366184 RepID=UPI0036967BE6
MEFGLTGARRERRDAMFDGARKRLHDASGPSSEQLSAPPSESPSRPFTRERWRAVAELGATGLCLPGEHGGGGLGALDTALCLEALSEGCGDTGLAFAVSAHLLACCVAIRDNAGEEVRAELLPGLASGELIAANAMTEDEAGSDVSRLATTAQRDGDHYVLDGVKSFASNAPMADVLVTYAVTDPALGFLGISAFAVPRDLPGVRVGEPMAKMGLDSCPAGRVEFSGCRVPARFRLGPEGGGSTVFQGSMAWERACLPAVYLGMMEEQLRRAVEHARARRQFGRALGDFQAVSHRLVTMKQRLEGARLLLYRACWALDEKDPDAATAAALSKIAVSEAAVASSLDAIQIFGATGYLGAAGVERQLRDAVPSTIFSGTTEIQRELVARGLGL